jgi:hypothetical protein
MVKVLEESQEEINKELKKIGGPRFSMDLREQWLETFREIKGILREIFNGTTGSDKDNEHRGESLHKDNELNDD